MARDERKIALLKKLKKIKEEESRKRILGDIIDTIAIMIFLACVSFIFFVNNMKGH
jgi:hypothetical protein